MRQLRISLLMVLGVLVLASTALLMPAPSRAQVTAEDCALLDDPEKRGLMDGLLFVLAEACDRPDVIGNPDVVFGHVRPGEGSSVPDILVNDPGPDGSGSSTTQSETSLTVNETTGTLCSGWNDSAEFFVHGNGFTGFGRSTDGGQTWEDRGGVDTVGGTDRGDPSIIWRKVDGNFYFATLRVGGALEVFESTDDCQTFSFLSIPATGSDDKELLAVDNNPASPFYGRIYLVWTDFGAGGPIASKFSTDGGMTWSAQITVGSGIVQGAWPTVAPNGDVYVAWLRYESFPSGDIDVRVARSTNGGVSFTEVTTVLLSATSPRDSASSGACGRPALNGLIRYLASPQIAVTSDGVVHVVYTYDPDGFNVGDVVNVYYRRSTDNGANWSVEMQLNEVSTNDQYFPTIFAKGTDLIASWYDRQYDVAEGGGNLLQDYQRRISNDAGLNWQPSERVTDVSSPIRLDPGTATCYHGDYDQSLIAAGGAQHVQWADDRNLCCVPERNDPDVWTESSNSIFGDGFESGDVGAWDQAVP